MKRIRKKVKVMSTGSWEVRNGQVSYVCPQCEIKEDIPADVVNLFDIIDPGDPSVSPRFRCEECGGAMLPV
jgi:predicted RNA-binding Zn-ribbon protein involved in translation (DUF1610 family)